MTTKNFNNTLYKDVEKIKAALFDTANDVRDQTSEMIYDSVEDIKDKSSLVKNTVADYTAEKPFKSLGIALLAGIAIGFLIKK